MYRDPSEFRERFKAYKEGKSVREIYGLPGYEPGKLPIEEMMPYILAVENPTKQGLVNGVWRPPTDSTKWDVHAIGGGLDIREQHNPIVYNYLKTNGRLASPFLTAKEEEILREKVFKKTMLPALLNVYNKYGDKISPKGYTRLAGMKWQGHPFLMAISPDSITGKAFIKAIESGDKDLDSVFDAYYKYPANAKRYAARIQADTNYWKNHNTVATKPVPQEPIIAVPDATRVSTIPTIQQLTVPSTWMLQATELPSHTFVLNFEMAKPLNIQKLVDTIEEYTPTWDRFKNAYACGKLPRYQNGREAVIQQGRKQLPIDKAEAATEPDYNDGWFLTTIKRGVNNAIKTVKDQVRAARNIINGRGSLGDYIEVGIDALTGAAGKLLSGSAKEAKHVAKRALKPTQASTKKFNTKDPNKVGAYYSAHPDEVTPITNNLDVKEVVNFMNNHVGPKYYKLNGVHVGIDPNDIKLGYADLSGSNLGGYVGPSGEVVINKDILNNRDLLRYVLGHEIAGHWFDLHYPLTVPQMSTVGYGMPFKQDFLAERPWFNAIKEANAERRAFLLMTYFDKGILGEDLDEAIKHMAKAEAKRYIDRLGYARGIDWQWPDILPFKQAATSVPAAGAGIYLAGNEEYKDGKLPGYYEGELPMGEKKQLTDEEVKLVAQNAPHEQGMSGEDPLMSMLVGMKAVRLVGDLLALRRLKERAEMYKRWREANELTRDTSRAWKMLDADRMARNWGYSDNPLGFLYDIFLDPLANLYTKVLKHPVLGPLIPFKDGKLPEYSDGKIRIKPANRGKFNATKKRTGKTTEELTHSKNPLTRKRAIFALNARKWNHK